MLILIVLSGIGAYEIITALYPKLDSGLLTLLVTFVPTALIIQANRFFTRLNERTRH